MNLLLLFFLVLYVLLIFAAAFLARKKIANRDDFLVAGRKLNLTTSTIMLFATWFGAGTLLTAVDEIWEQGLGISLLEPYGAGACLIIAGLFFAKPLWKLKLCTLAEFFGKKFGTKAEHIFIICISPSFLLWIAVQLIASAHILEIFLGVEFFLSILVVAVLVTSYVLIGGMWSIAYLDSIQIVLIILGLFGLLVSIICCQDNYSDLYVNSDVFSGDLKVKFQELFKYTNIFLIASLGNIPGQDFAQRVFSAKSAQTAKKACLYAGILYVLIGSVPVYLGLISHSMLSSSNISGNFVLLSLAQKFLHPVLLIFFIIAIFAAIFSTLDSSILATAAPLSQFMPKKIKNYKISSLGKCQISVVGVSILSVFIALFSQNTFDMLEAAYSSGLAMFFVPLCIGLFAKNINQKAAQISMLVGACGWALDILFLRLGFSIVLIACIASFMAYYISVFVLEKFSTIRRATVAK